jgi:glycosyltransferase involved in cell wall biosynthesis
MFRKTATFRKHISAMTTQYQVNSIVIVMSHPGDLILNQLKESQIRVIRIIHDIRKHPGDFWPSKLELRYLLKVDEIIVLSRYVFETVNHERKVLSTLSRRKYVGSLSDIPGMPPSYILITGRFKKYKNLAMLEKVIINFPNVNFVCAGQGSTRFKDFKNVTVLARWLSDSEMESLIKNAAGLVAIYSEASQSGVVDQAIFWRVPVLVSNVGALVEQARCQNTNLVCDHISLSSIVNGIENLLTQNRDEIPNQVVKETLMETLIRI